LSVDLDISVVSPKTYLVFGFNIVPGFLLLCFLTLDTAVYPVKYNMVNELFHDVKFESYIVITGTAIAQWSRCCATNRKVAGSIPAGVIGIFH